LLQKPKIAAKINNLEAEASRALGLTRADVMAELVEAADLARAQQQPGAMISAWKTVAQMSGFYKPEEVKPRALTPAQAAIRSKYEAMSTEELLAILAG